jgi:site-specific DNA recombinase
MKRCAIYTRKSTEEGLEQDFNSLQAQREACDAFIRSQKHEGWKLVRTRFDDGGYSGGTLERPALQQLIEAVDRGEIEVVVVYKVDRLTRSLADFAKIVERFDERNVSFVSVTQQFNTTSSMGRLTLNVLLSFAQFEREVTAERIRDKIAASKKKGMWMGGPPPLGYDVVDKKLVVNRAEAETVRTLFRLYRELGTVRNLLSEANRLGVVTKHRATKDGSVTGGKAFTGGNLYQLLGNPLYTGRIRHKGNDYPGQHEAIIDDEMWQAVQQQLSGNGTPRRTNRNAKLSSLLTGLLYDETGDRLCPSHANKNGKRYRYYISKRLVHDAGDQQGWRLPAREIEATVVGIITTLLNDRRRLLDELSDVAPAQVSLRKAVDAAKRLAADLRGEDEALKRDLIQDLIGRIEVGTDVIVVAFRRQSLLERLGVGTNVSTGENEPLVIREAAQLRRRGIEVKLVLPDYSDRERHVDQSLCQLVANARYWFETLANGHVGSVRELAARDRVPESEITRVLPLAFMAPNIVEAVLDGRQPLEMTATSLRRVEQFPSDWTAQRDALGI